MGHKRLFTIVGVATLIPDLLVGAQAVAQTDQSVRPTVIAQRTDPPSPTCQLIFQDETFLFCSRGYGRATDPGGNTEPGFFVHSKIQDRWLQITAISTALGTFGRTPPGFPLVQVSWDFTDAGRRPYIDQPLRTSGSIAFPDSITYDRASGRYTLRYFSQSGLAVSAEVVLYVARVDLRAVVGPQ